MAALSTTLRATLARTLDRIDGARTGSINSRDHPLYPVPPANRNSNTCSSCNAKRCAFRVINSVPVALNNSYCVNQLVS